MVSVLLITVFGVLSAGPHCSCAPPSPPHVKRYRHIEVDKRIYECRPKGIEHNTRVLIESCNTSRGLTSQHCVYNCFEDSKLIVKNTHGPNRKNAAVGVSRDASANSWNTSLHQRTKEGRFTRRTLLKCAIIQLKVYRRLLRNKTPKVFKLNSSRKSNFEEHHSNLTWCSLAKRVVHKSKTKRLKRSPDSRPELVYTFIEQAVQPGAQVALKCSAVGEPPPRFKWTLDSQPMPPHHGAVITEGRESGPSGMGPSGNYVLSTLSLSSARVEHGGRYECRASNAHGSVAHAARLNVYGSPYIRSMSTVKAVAGSDTTVWCPYYGFPIE